MPRHPARAGSSADPLEVARELLDGVDRPDALDLDRDPAVVYVTAHQVDRTDVGGPLALARARSASASASGARRAPPGGPARRRPSPARRLAHVVRDVAQHLVEPDLEPVLRLSRRLRTTSASPLLDHGRRRHPVQRLVAAGVGVDEHGAVGLEDQQARRLGQEGRQTARVADFAAGDEQAHEPRPYCPFRTGPQY